MRALAFVVACLCALGAATPAYALEFCDKIQDPGQRMACLQAHISHLEESLLNLSTQIVDLRNELRRKLDADAVYKWQYVAKGGCLGFSEEDKTLVLQGCDNPDSWKLVPGAQKPSKKAKPKTDD